jgi:hypothetical protein
MRMLTTGLGHLIETDKGVLYIEPKLIPARVFDDNTHTTSLIYNGFVAQAGIFLATSLPRDESSSPYTSTIRCYAAKSPDVSEDEKLKLILEAHLNSKILLSGEREIAESALRDLYLILKK